MRLDVDGAIATITNDNPDKHNAFDDDMDAAAVRHPRPSSRDRPDVRAVVWRGEGKSFSSGRDVAAIGTRQTELSHHELMRRGHRGIQQLWELDAPVIVACKGWVMGGIVPAGAALRHPHRRRGHPVPPARGEHGVIPDTGGMGVLYEMCGHGVVSDLVLTGRVMTRRGSAAPRHRQPDRRRPTSSTRSPARWPSRSRPRRR